MAARTRRVPSEGAARATKRRVARCVTPRTARRSIGRRPNNRPAASVERAYEWRKVLVERVFGLLKWNDGFRRFTVWGRVRASAVGAVCAAFNVRALYRRWRVGEFRLAATG
ncbi:MAG: transposase [Polyangiales bacterium]